LFYRARYYDPKVGRFISEDPIGFEGVVLTFPQTLNFYAYNFNNPINFTDPSGENPALIRALALAAKIVARLTKQFAKLCKEIRCTIHIDPPHHRFPWGQKHCHVQVDCYLKGVRKSNFLTIRIPFPCGLGGGK
jgi:hypothetical protein